MTPTPEQRERAAILKDCIKQSIPFRPDLSHTDAFQDSQAENLIAQALADEVAREREKIRTIVHDYLVQMDSAFPRWEPTATYVINGILTKIDQRGQP